MNSSSRPRPRSSRPSCGRCARSSRRHPRQTRRRRINPPPSRVRLSRCRRSPPPPKRQPNRPRPWLPPRLPPPRLTCPSPAPPSPAHAGARRRPSLVVRNPKVRQSPPVARAQMGPRPSPHPVVATDRARRVQAAPAPADRAPVTTHTLLPKACPVRAAQGTAAHVRALLAPVVRAMVVLVRAHPAPVVRAMVAPAPAHPAQVHPAQEATVPTRA